MNRKQKGNLKTLSPKLNQRILLTLLYFWPKILHSYTTLFFVPIRGLFSLFLFYIFISLLILLLIFHLLSFLFISYFILLSSILLFIFLLIFILFYFIFSFLVYHFIFIRILSNKSKFDQSGSNFFFFMHHNSRNQRTRFLSPQDFSFYELTLML